MAVAIDYQKIMTQIVYVNLPGPEEPTERMSGGEMLHGFLSDLHKAEDAAVKQYVSELCMKWNVHYRQAPK
ncbi:hypothetical protein ACFLVE_02240 [Chloroflexota bacterium]